MAEQISNRKVVSRVPRKLFSYETGEGNPYYAKWRGDHYAKDVAHVNVDCTFKHNKESNVVILFDTRMEHAGYLGALWVTDQFENDGFYLYVAETEAGEAAAFEYYQTAIKWLQSKH